MKAKLRSQAWFGGTNRESFIHRSWTRGYPPDVFDGRPVIGICNTYSELTPCNAHLRSLADAAFLQWRTPRQRVRADTLCRQPHEPGVFLHLQALCKGTVVRRHP